jgi:hypothetical protein
MDDSTSQVTDSFGETAFRWFVYDYEDPLFGSHWWEAAAAIPALKPLKLGKVVKALPGTGSFDLINWAKYPSWAPKPTGTLRVLAGAEYDAARKAANAANAALRRADPAAYAGKQIHEIIPVKFGGSPTDIANKIAVTPAQHAELTNFWNQLMRGLP